MNKRANRMATCLLAFQQTIANGHLGLGGWQSHKKTWLPFRTVDFKWNKTFISFTFTTFIIIIVHRHHHHHYYYKDTTFDMCFVTPFSIISSSSSSSSFIFSSPSSSKYFNNKGHQTNTLDMNKI